ncbi:hypothetical protein OGAPHI_007442 [Ogataea philodendri]|uniref:Glycine cleavage system H protein n=1 Tax=Ogataea philodendri TaxID=1378263 RepID=A0A9P8NW11_9ASCO|nr:uncharacterized protein OGAPHI_007442 [Ogataea philodendri]KAH3660237.1 hypothetical protein OGAPHI_007442 [Ogataea philodendri]
MISSVTRQLVRSGPRLFLRHQSNVLNTSSVVFNHSKGPVTLKFTDQHEWISHHPDGVTYVGITKYASDALGDTTFIELPHDSVGEQVAKGDVIGSVESVKSASEVYSPVDGEVLEVNTALEESPELVNKDPMGDGWIVKIKVEELGPDLLSEEDYVKLLQED